MKRLISNQIIHAYLVTVICLLLALWLMTPDRVNSTLDAYAVAACIMVMIRLGALAWASIWTHRPSPGQVLVIAVFGLAFTIGGLRVLRTIGIEFGIIHSDWVHVAFALLTAAMIYCLMLVVTAPELTPGRTRLTPWAALLLAVIGGTLINAFNLLVLD